MRRLFVETFGRVVFGSCLVAWHYTSRNTVLLTGWLFSSVSCFPYLWQGVFWSSSNILQSLIQVSLAYVSVACKNICGIVVKPCVHNLFWTMTCQNCACGFRMFILFSPWVKSNFHWPLSAEAKAKASFFLCFFLGEGREKERKRNIDVWEKHWLVASHTPPTRDPACNPGMGRLVLSPLSHTSRSQGLFQCMISF